MSFISLVKWKICIFNSCLRHSWNINIFHFTRWNKSHIQQKIEHPLYVNRLSFFARTFQQELSLIAHFWLNFCWKMANSSKLFLNLLYLEILLNFNMKVLHWTQTTRRMGINKNTICGNDLKNFFLMFKFSPILYWIWETFKTSIKLNHFKIGKSEL